MSEQKNWDSLYEAIEAMNQASPCLVLRNYEDMSNDNYYMEGHDDIDFLCENQKKAVSALEAGKNVYWGSSDHFIVKIAGKDVKFGLRYIGDGYYDALWERRMLDNRVLVQNAFYVMSRKDYFYSLLYHVLFQKQRVADDYRSRLTAMGQELGFELSSDKEFLDCLIRYLESNNYTVEYPSDPTVPIHYNDVPSNLLGNSFRWKLKRLLFKPRCKIHNVSQKWKVE